MIICVFYGSFFIKMLLQGKKGIKTDRLGKGSKGKKTFVIESLLKSFTLLTGITQLISIIFEDSLHVLVQNSTARFLGLAIALSGVFFFITAIVTMRNSWRAGIDYTQKTELIKTGIYQYSRNPAFVGFDLLYIGMGLAFFNIIHVLVTCTSILLLHLQILEEEKYLPTVFGEDYLNYRSKTRRYFGKYRKVFNKNDRERSI